jgi:hypothetical protein
LPGWQWNNEPRVTLIGDAVHVMTPAGGVGANTALRDAALLGRSLADAGGRRRTVASVDDVPVDGERAIPQFVGFYGGWITSEVTDPFKGIPGSMGW